MPEIPALPEQSETLTELRTASSEVIKTPAGFDAGYGLTKDDVPAEITPDAALPQCPAHPDARWKPGLGYAGGGFGAYKVCVDCGAIFGKTEMKGV